MRELRAFIAIELPGHIKAKLLTLRDRFKITGQSHIRWTKEDGIHLTLRFLGNIPTDSINPIIASMRDAAAAVYSFNLKIARLGAFPNLGKVQVIWAGVNGDLIELQKLHHNLESFLALAGFAADKRVYTPHLTLGRVRDDTPLPVRLYLGKIISESIVETNASFKVNSLSLIRSELTPGGAIYTTLNSVNLNTMTVT